MSPSGMSVSPSDCGLLNSYNQEGYNQESLFVIKTHNH